MAKVDTLKFLIDGIEYSSNINVGKSGIFTCHLHWRVSQAIGLTENKLEFEKLDELTNKVLPLYHKYLESKEEDTIWISIDFKVSGLFSFDPNKEERFVSSFTGNKIFYDNSASILDNRMNFDFKVLIKTVRSNGSETWYNTTFENGFWKKTGVEYTSKELIIPYSDLAHESLLKARKGLQNICLSLYNLLNQDSKNLLESLENGGILESQEKLIQESGRG